MTPKSNEVPREAWNRIHNDEFRQAVDAIVDGDPDKLFQVQLLVTRAVQTAAPLIREDEAERQEGRFPA